MIERTRLKPENTDVRPYEVDNKVYMCEITTGINMYYYWQPTYGEDATKAIDMP